MHIMKYSTLQMLSQTHIGSLSLISLMDSYSVSFPSSIDKCLSFTYTLKCWRIVAQRLAHLVRDQGVGGSNPPCPKRGHRLCWCTTQSRKEACFAPEMTIFRCFFVMYVQLIAEIPLTKTKVHQTGRQPRQDLQNDRNIRLFIRDPLSFLVLVSNRTGNFYYYCMIQIR